MIDIPALAAVVKATAIDLQHGVPVDRKQLASLLMDAAQALEAMHNYQTIEDDKGRPAGES